MNKETKAYEVLRDMPKPSEPLMAEEAQTQQIRMMKGSTVQIPVPPFIHYGI